MLVAASVWLRRQYREWRDRRAARRRRTWHGYIDLGGIASWHVRLAERPDRPDGRVVLEVLAGPAGEPDAMRAQSLRQQVDADGLLARSPTLAEYDFLKSLRKHRGYGEGQDPDADPVR